MLISPVSFTPIVLHLTAILQVLQVVVFVLVEDAMGTLLFLDLRDGLQHVLGSFVVSS